MYFKTCQHYKKAEKQEHCPFGAICNEPCIFAYLKPDITIDDLIALEDELAKVSDQLREGRVELDNCTMLLGNRDETINIMCDIIAKLLVKARIKKIDKYINELEQSYQNDIKDKMGILINPQPL